MSLAKAKPTVKPYPFLLPQDLALEILPSLSCIIIFPFLLKILPETYKVAVIYLAVKTKTKRHHLMTLISFSSYCMFLPSLYRKASFKKGYIHSLQLLYTYSLLSLLHLYFCPITILQHLLSITLMIDALLNPVEFSSSLPF